MTVFESTFRVRSYELDSFGHLNHAVFLNYFEQARFDAFEAAGFAPRTLEERGWGIHVVRIEVDYLAEARLGDHLRVVTEVEEFRRTSMTFVQRMVRTAPDEVAVCEARVVAVWIGTNGRPMRIPDEARAGF